MTEDSLVTTRPTIGIDAVEDRATHRAGSRCGRSGEDVVVAAMSSEERHNDDIYLCERNACQISSREFKKSSSS